MQNTSQINVNGSTQEFGKSGSLPGIGASPGLAGSPAGELVGHSKGLGSSSDSGLAPDRFYIKTFGCQMNVSDSERMAALLAEQGLQPADGPSDAGVIIINGCTVREKAVHKALSTLGEFQELKQDGRKGPIIGIGGCVGQLDRGKLFARAPYVDFVFGTDTIDSLPEIVYRVRNGERHVVYADFDKSMNFSTETKVFGAKAQAFVNIMKGCDKYCSYCIVPFTRGREKSRTIDEVVADVANLVAKGVREVTLLGQNVNSFGKGNPNSKNRQPSELHNVIGKVGPRAGEENFSQLVRAIDEDPRCIDLRRIRFTSSHPLDFSDELIECYAAPEKGGVARLASHLHLPVQSGSNRVLQKMGRHHKIETYISQMDRLREVCPDVGLSTDLIVGFPTETEEDFQETLRLLDRVQYDNIYAFAYSPRPGTRAAKMVDDVPLEVKKDRLNRLLNYQLKIAEKVYAERVGKVMEILVEGEAKNQKLVLGSTKRPIQQVPEQMDKQLADKGGSMNPGDFGSSGSSDVWGRSSSSSDQGVRKVWTGRTTCNRVVNFISDSPRSWVGKLIDVKITGATGLSLQGEIVNGDLR